MSNGRMFLLVTSVLTLFKISTFNLCLFIVIHSLSLNSLKTDLSKYIKYNNKFGFRSICSHPLSNPELVNFQYEGVIEKASISLQNYFYKIDLKTKKMIDKIQTLFRENNVDASAFNGVNGYGYGDLGREKFDSIIASLFGAESALVRLQLFSGTHAISTALFASVRPGDQILGVSGHPYDTLEEVLGLRNNTESKSNVGSLMDWGVSYDEVELLFKESAMEVNKGAVAFDLDAIDEKLRCNPSIKLIHIQRSCGYQFRPSIPIVEIGRLCDHLIKNYKNKGRSLVIFVDNCYGELVEELEPTHVGADLVAGSLIKNLGGTLAPCGGYIAGRRDLVSAAAVHLSAPGVEGGATLNQYKYLFQGLFMAPSIVGESLKGAELLAEVMQTHLGYPCFPPPGSYRTDIIQAVRLGTRKKLISFCESVQRKSPVGSHIRPIPGFTSGYGEEVIFADGTFIEGSTLELSADGPLREPYVAYSQGSTHWTHWAIVLEEVLKQKAFNQ